MRRPRSLRRLLAAPARLGRWIRGNAAELTTGAAAVGGWALLTLGVAHLEVWPASGGLLLLSACGWRFLGTIAMDGLYTLSRRDRRE